MCTETSTRTSVNVGTTRTCTCTIYEYSCAPYCCRHNGYLSEVSGLRETTYREGIHDLKLLLLRFAEEKSFSEDSGGGGRLSNALLAPHLLQAALYVLNSYARIGAN